MKTELLSTSFHPLAVSFDNTSSIRKKNSYLFSVQNRFRVQTYLLGVPVFCVECRHSTLSSGAEATSQHSGCRPPAASAESFLHHLEMAQGMAGGWEAGEGSEWGEGRLAIRP